MLTDLKEFKINDLDNFQKIVFNKRNEPDYFLQFGEVVSNLESESLYLDTYNPLFSRISLSQEDSTVTFLSISGMFDITFDDLTNLYGKSREAYSWYDELYFFFFNEKSREECSIGIYSEKKVIESFNTLQLWLKK